MRGPYLLVGVLAVLFLVVVFVQKPPLDWRPDYEGDSARPLGAELFYTLLPEWIGAPVEPTTAPPFLLLEDTTFSNTLYVFLAEGFDPDPVEAERLYAFAERGNTVFVAADHLGGVLRDTLGLTDALADSLAQPRGLYFYAPMADPDSSLTLVGPTLGRTGAYDFPRAVGARRIRGLDPARSTVLGLASDSAATLARIAVGEGAFVLSTTPDAFTNVMLAREGDAADYVGGVLGLLTAERPVERVLWDTYYKPRPRLAQTPLRVVLASPSLRWGYGLLLLGAVLFVLFRGRRWQRPIPVVAPPLNAQLEFVRTVGRLYAQHDDRRALVDRKQRYFFDRLRARLGLADLDLSEATEQRVARRSGVAEGQVRVLFTRFRRLGRTAVPSADDLLALDRDLDRFYDAIGGRS